MTQRDREIREREIISLISFLLKLHIPLMKALPSWPNHLLNPTCWCHFVGIRISTSELGKTQLSHPWRSSFHRRDCRGTIRWVTGPRSNSRGSNTQGRKWSQGRQGQSQAPSMPLLLFVGSEVSWNHCKYDWIPALHLGRTGEGVRNIISCVVTQGNENIPLPKDFTQILTALVFLRAKKHQ